MLRPPKEKTVTPFARDARRLYGTPFSQSGTRRNRQMSLGKRKVISRSVVAILLGLSISSVGPGLAFGDDTPEFTIEMKDGAITPERLTIPAGKTVKIIVKNTGSTPAEFESRRLRKEKVLSPGAESFVVLRGLSAGEYPFFDEFHTDAKPGVIIAE
jgi:hypothetical protein